MLNVTKLLADLRQLAVDVRSHAGFVAIARDVVTLADDGLDLSEAIGGLIGPSSPDQPPAAVVQAKVGAHGPATRSRIADELDLAGDELVVAHSKVPEGQVGAFGDGQLLKNLAKKVAPWVIQAVIAAMTAA